MLFCPQPVAFGLSGYLTYGDDTEGNVTENFSNSSIIALVARYGETSFVWT